jgi:hypothetical protein
MSYQKLRQKILFICGSMNQTTQMHQIAKELPECDSYFTPYYPDGYGYIELLTKIGLMDFSILGGQARLRTIRYLSDNNLKIDLNGRSNDYDLVFTCSDMLIQKNIRDKKVILVQEGMTDPENLGYFLAKKFNLPRWLGGTSTTGISDQYDLFCVASEGYKELFISKGVKQEKIVVTGIPNFDNCSQYINNDFPYRGFVLVATSDMRETYKYENRKKFILKAVQIAKGRQLIFKLHPNENYIRAKKEIQKYAPEALIFHLENIEPMIANCEILITRFSSVVYVGLALGKQVYSDFNLDELNKLLPIQNGGKSALIIAQIGRKLLAEQYMESEEIKNKVQKISKFKLIRRFRTKQRLARIKH